VFADKLMLSPLFFQAYVACAWGISNIGYVMICYGITNSISAISTGSIVKLTGRVPVVCCAFLLHLGIIIFLLTWAPTPDDKILFFVVTGLWGISDGVWLVQINGKLTRFEHSSLFFRQTEAVRLYSKCARRTGENKVCTKLLKR
jgi:predicted MFS family arabinose efflux permease